MKPLTVRFGFFLVLLLLSGQFCFAQNAGIKGTVIDTSEKKNLTHSVIALIRKSDSLLTAFTRSDQNGQFTLNNLPAGKFYIMITYPAYADYLDEIELTGNSVIDLHNINLTLKSQLLEEVIVTRKLGAIRIKGDTIEYKADSFYLSAGSTVEDLLKKLPGIQVDKDGKITAQGQTVQKVLVDGEEFFSDDPTIATRGLTADAVDKVQVFDKKSDQAEFTGIDDGQRTRTIDLKLKEDRKKGHFGKLELGSDGNEYWNNSFMLNAFKGKRKFAAFGIMSGTGKTGLDWQENMNYGGTSGNMEMGMSDDGGMYISVSNSDEFDRGNFFGEGLPKGWSGGLHYSNKWNEDKLHFNGGYRFNKINAAARGNSFSQYILPNTDTLLFVNENGDSYSSKDRHRLNGMYEWQIDSLASIKITAEGWTGTSENNNNFKSESLNNFGDTLSLVDRQTISAGDNKAFNTTLLYRQKFKKQGRTLSVNMRQNYGDNQSEGFLFSDNRFYEDGLLVRTEAIDQQKINDNISASVNSRISYTEPLSKKSILEFNYNISNNHRQSRITTLEKPAPNGKYDQMVDSLSNDYSFNVLTNAGGINYRYAKPKKITLSFGVNVSKANFTRKDLQADSTTDYSFTNFFPQANMTFNLGQSGNLRFNYFGNTQAPSIDQIQPIQDNTDQLNIRVGNPDLKQAFRHAVNFSYNSYKFLSERSIYTNLNFSTTQNAFSSSNEVDATGRKVYKPVNVDGNYSLNGWLYYSKKLKKLNVRLGFEGDLRLNRAVNFINSAENASTSYAAGGGPNINYEKAKKFTISLRAGFYYNNSKSSIQPDLVTDYWTQSHTAQVTVFLPWKMELYSYCIFNFRQKTDAFDRDNNSIKWDARLDKKILKNDAGRIRFAAFDMLDQNIGFTRSINSNFISEKTYNTLRRYFMLSFIWNFSMNGKPQQW